MAKILSVEDDFDLQQVYSYVLKTNGWEAVFAYDGKDGLEKALSLKPDVILLDMMLPGLNGLGVLKSLRENEATRMTPVVVMTAYPTDPQFLENAIKSWGDVEYLVKPVHVDDLVLTIKRLLSR